MGASSNEVPPPGGGGTGPSASEALGRNSFERFTNFHMPSVAGRSVSHEEGLVAMALLGCAGKRPLSRSSGGRVDSGAWADLLSAGGEVQDLALGGRKHPDSTNDPKAQWQRQQQQQEARQQRLEMEELQKSMPTTTPFSVDRCSRSGSNNSRSSSRKARFLSREVDSATLWPTTSTESGNLCSLLNPSYKSSSGSGSSGGGGPSGEGGGRGATANAGGGRSSGNGGGGGASWERAPYPDALPSAEEAGGAATTRDGIITSNSNNNRKSGYGHHPLRQQSFQPDRPVGDLPSAEDICADQTAPWRTATCGGVREWEKAAAVGTITASRSQPTSVTTTITTSGGVSGSRDHENVPLAAPASPPSSHRNHNHNINTGGPIAPAPARRVQPLATAPPAPVHHERKPSYNLLAMMIPDISKFGAPSTAAPLHAPGAAPGAASGGAGFSAARGFAPAAAHFSPADSYLRVGVQGDGVWTRQAALARYRFKKKRRHLVKINRENDPHLKVQNLARKRPRQGGKFRKAKPDFVSICEVQKAAKSRSSSGELPLRESTPPPPPSTRSARAESQAAAGIRARTRGGGAQEGSTLYMLTPSDAAKLGLN